MATYYEDQRSRSGRTRHFRTGVGRHATPGWISAALLAVAPCWALPPGVVYSTTVPYSNATITLLAGNPSVAVVATDVSGNTYVAGSIYANNLASTPGVVQPTFAGGACPDEYGLPVDSCADAFIAKFDSTGKLLFLTYLGGTGQDVPISIAVDSSGNIYVGGQTNSKDFPLAGTPWRPALTNEGTFVAKLSGDGTKLIWSTVLNGKLFQLAIAPNGSVYYGTQTVSTGPSGVITASLTQLTQDGQLVANVPIPANTNAIAVGPDGSVFIGGNSFGDVTATPGAWQTSPGGSTDGFAAKMNASLSGFTWLTLVAGTGMDSVNTLQPAPDGSLWIMGGTSSSNFPVLAGAWQSQPSGQSGFLVRLSPDGSKALASTYLPAVPTYLAMDASGNAIIGASGLNAFQATPGATWPCQQPGGTYGATGFFGKIDSAGRNLLWGSWSGPSVPFGPVAVDFHGNAVVAGSVPGGDVVLSALTPAPGPPMLVETCVVSSGYPYAYGPLAAGELVSIYGAGFGPQQGVGAQPSGNAISTELAGVQVLIENQPAPLLYVSSAQINLVAPYLLDGRIAAHIKIVTANGTSNEVVLGVAQAAPEIFAYQVSAPLPLPTAAIINQDGTVNGPDHPAHVGDIVAMYVSGLGQTNPPGVDGAIPTEAGGTPVLPIMVQVLNPGVNWPYANVTYAGNAPELVSGVAQVNFQVPSGIIQVGAGPPWETGVVLWAGGICSSLPVCADGPVIWFE